MRTRAVPARMRVGNDFAGHKIAEGHGDDGIDIGVTGYARGRHVREQPYEGREGQQRSEDDEIEQRC